LGYAYGHSAYGRPADYGHYLPYGALSYPYPGHGHYSHLPAPPPFPGPLAGGVFVAPSHVLSNRPISVFGGGWHRFGAH
jgi:hypothetical protein